jgi:hypothetical protein
MLFSPADCFNIAYSSILFAFNPIFPAILGTAKGSGLIVQPAMETFSSR